MKRLLIFCAYLFSFCSYGGSGSGVGIPAHGISCKGTIVSESTPLDTQVSLFTDFDDRFYEMMILLNGDSLSRKNERCYVLLPQEGKTERHIMICDRNLGSDPREYEVNVSATTPSSFSVKNGGSASELSRYDFTLDKTFSKLSLKVALSRGMSSLVFQGRLGCE